ncbi:MAG: hypothetical protein WCP85_16865 [Mariniphaga sp.]
MKKLSLFILILLINSNISFSHFAIDIDGSGPYYSAILDVKSNNKGFLPPRMTQAEMKPIPNPADGLIIYCSDCRPDGNGVLAIFMDGDWNSLTINCFVPKLPTVLNIGPLSSGIVWDWKGVTFATGYKWSGSNNYSTATQMDTVTTKTETGLACNAAYTRYVWAYNVCGNSLPLTIEQTMLICSVPTLTTMVVSSIAITIATSGGYITYDGGSNVTVHGVCWGTDPNPTIANSTTTDGSGIGNFSNTFNVLTKDTNYYLRAYATNSFGTGALKTRLYFKIYKILRYNIEI